MQEKKQAISYKNADNIRTVRIVTKSKLAVLSKSLMPNWLKFNSRDKSKRYITIQCSFSISVLEIPLLPCWSRPELAPPWGIHRIKLTIISRSVIIGEPNGWNSWVNSDITTFEWMRSACFMLLSMYVYIVCGCWCNECIPLAPHPRTNGMGKVSFAASRINVFGLGIAC